MLTLNQSTYFLGRHNLNTLAKDYGTPLYIYDQQTILDRFQAFQQAFGTHDHQICYSVKANSNLAVLQTLAKAGAGFDLVSKGELARVIKAGGNPKRCTFSGVGKTLEDITYALQHQIGCFNVESLAELDMIQHIAASLQCKAPISLRINPDVDAKTHPYISTGLKENKFGISIDNAQAAYLYAQSLPNLDIVGIDCHIGSQLTELSPYQAALDRLLILVDQLAHAGIALKHLDIGGGIGIRYQDEQPIIPAEWIQLILSRLGARQLKIVIEPGRSIVADAGLLLTKIILLKENEGKHFAVVDAAMNDMIRPALYGAWMNMIPVNIKPHLTKRCYDIVGPICESTDYLAKERTLAIETNDLLVMTQAGAYGFVMSSNYNSRPRAAEIMIDCQQNVHTVRQRETLDDLYSKEQLLD